MGLQTPRGFRFSHGLKLLAVYIAFCSVVPTPSEGVKLRTSLPGYLEKENPKDIYCMLNKIREDLDNLLHEGKTYKPGTAALISYTLPTDKRLIFRVNYWNPGTCNLGLGSPRTVTPIPGKQLSNIVQRLLGYIESLILQYTGSGSCTEQGVSIDYFPDMEDDASSCSQDDPNKHEHGESQVARPQLPAGRSNSSSVRRGKRSTGPKAVESDGAASLSSRSTGYGLNHKTQNANRLTASQKTKDSLVVTNPTIDTYSPTVPTPLDGDCDLPSLLLMTGTGPEDDTTGVHSYSTLSQGDRISSPNTRFVLEMLYDCNLALYDSLTSTELWSSGTSGQGTKCFAGLTMSGDFAVFDWPGTSLWRSKTACVPKSEAGKCWTNSILQVQDDGDLVLYIFKHQYPLWRSHTVQCPTGCVLD